MVPLQKPGKDAFDRSMVALDPSMAFDTVNHATASIILSNLQKFKYFPKIINTKLHIKKQKLIKLYIIPND